MFLDREVLGLLLLVDELIRLGATAKLCHNGECLLAHCGTVAGPFSETVTVDG